MKTCFKRTLMIVLALMMVLVLAGCGGGSNDGGSSSDGGSDSGGSASGAIDPFDPAIFNVEEGGIVFHYEVSSGTYPYITDVDIENQLPEDDIRSTFKYKIVGAEEGDYIDELIVGQKVAVEVDVPDEFWDEHDLTDTRTDFTIPPVPYAYIAYYALPEEALQENFPKFTQDLEKIINGPYYDSEYDAEADEYVGKTGLVREIIEPDELVLDPCGAGYFRVSAKATKEFEDGETRYVTLGYIAYVYDENKDLVFSFGYPVCDATGDTNYYFKDEDNRFPNSDDVMPETDPEETDVDWVDDLPESDRYLHVEYHTDGDYIRYTYNRTTGELTKVSE